MRRFNSVVGAGLFFALVLCALQAGEAKTEQVPESKIAATAKQPEKREWAKKLDKPTLKNFYKVSDTLYRSYQPTSAGMKELEAMGVVSVVNLRHLHDDADEAKGTKLKLFHIKTDAWKGGIKVSELVAFLKIVTNPQRQPTLVHCKHGSDRTGTMCAVYRIAVQDWSKDEAIEEMTKGPYGYHEIWSSLPKFIRSLDIESIRKQAGIEVAPQKEEPAKSTPLKEVPQNVSEPATK